MGKPEPSCPNWGSSHGGGKGVGWEGVMRWGGGGGLIGILIFVSVRSKAKPNSVPSSLATGENYHYCYLTGDFFFWGGGRGRGGFSHFCKIFLVWNLSGRRSSQKCLSSYLFCDCARSEETQKAKISLQKMFDSLSQGTVMVRVCHRKQFWLKLNAFCGSLKYSQTGKDEKKAKNKTV